MEEGTGLVGKKSVCQACSAHSGYQGIVLSAVGVLGARKSWNADEGAASVGWLEKGVDAQ